MMSDDGDVRRVRDAELYYDENLIFTHNGERFTGIGYEDDPKLGRLEVSYRDGLQHGISRSWYASGRLSGESHYYENSLHGPMREYDENGVLREERLYDHDIVVRSVICDADGRVLESFELREGDTNHGLLERYRRWHPWPPPGE